MLRVVHVALVAGVTMFGGVLVFLQQGKMSRTPDFNDPLCQAAVAAVEGGILLGANLHRFFFRSAAAKPDLSAAFHRYARFVLVRASFLDGGAVFAAVVTFLRHNVLPLGMLVLGAVALAFYRPSAAEFERLISGEQRGEWQ